MDRKREDTGRKRDHYNNGRNIDRNERRDRDDRRDDLSDKYDYNKRDIYSNRSGHGDYRHGTDSHNLYLNRSRTRSKSPAWSNEKKAQHSSCLSSASSNSSAIDEPKISEPIVPKYQENNYFERIDEDNQLSEMFGFSGFASTKGQKVKGNEFNEAVDMKIGKGKKKREYRQYLYVKGSYDIPLTKDQLEAKKDEKDTKTRFNSK